jgi:hypothetical protein
MTGEGQQRHGTERPVGTDPQLIGTIWVSAPNGLMRVAQDWKLLAGAANLARFAILGLRSTATGWQLQPA